MQQKDAPAPHRAPLPATSDYHLILNLNMRAQIRDKRGVMPSTTNEKPEDEALVARAAAYAKKLAVVDWYVIALVHAIALIIPCMYLIGGASWYSNA